MAGAGNTRRWKVPVRLGFTGRREGSWKEEIDATAAAAGQHDDISSLQSEVVLAFRMVW